MCVRERNGSIINRSLHIIAHASLFIFHLRQDHHSLLTMGCPRSHSAATTTLCLMWSSVAMDSLPSQDLGTIRFKSGTLAREISTCVYVAQIDCRLHHCKTCVYIIMVDVCLDVEISPAQTTPHVITKV